MNENKENVFGESEGCFFLNLVVIIFKRWRGLAPKKKMFGFHIKIVLIQFVMSVIKRRRIYSLSFGSHSASGEIKYRKGNIGQKISLINSIVGKCTENVIFHRFDEVKRIFVAAVVVVDAIFFQSVTQK